jgi:DNA-binding LacI/PurR family transcriptional regulator
VGERQTVAHRLAQTLVLWTKGQESVGPDRFTGDNLAVDSGIVDQARQIGRDLLLVHWDGRNTERIEAIMEDHPRGVLATGDVVHSVAAQSVLQRLVARGVPLIVNCSWLVPDLYDRLMYDHEAGCYELTRWLLSQGRKRILRFWTHLKPWMPDRDRGYERAMREAGLEPLSFVDTTIPDSVRHGPKGLDCVARILAGHLIEHLRAEQPIDAVLLPSDDDALPMHQACQACGIEPHRDLAIAGYDNQYALCWRRQGAEAPPTVTIDKQNHLAGQTMVDLLLRRAEAPTAVNPQTHWMAPKLVVP